MENNLENLTIGVFAKAAGVNVETIRFYQRKGLLREPDKPYGSIRRYGEADVVRVKFVKSAQRLGFSLDEIAELLRLDDGTHCEEASSLAEHKLKDVREKMADLARMETVLSELVCACHARKGNVSCPLIASLQAKQAWQGQLCLSVLYLMRWSLPPSRYYAEDRLSFGELSWKTLRSLVSIWVKTLSIFIARIVAGRLFTVKNLPGQS
ncbi:mercuric resistance operon regulatory protein [Klebsiella pneumoniae]|uniref:Mercuric resistance operon regulatory protein n=29 Tax=cellular organisms TaxID=131567 RepID=A0A377UP71_KLEPN|nr:mercuric resistance operon regulatory protein [Klebsiella pneumoniae]